MAWRIAGAFVVLLCMVSCLQATGESGEGLEPLLEGEALSVEEPASCPIEEPVELRYTIVPEEGDLELCAALDERADRCGCEPAPSDTCSQRYACSRQMWRADIVEDVYACIEERPCGDTDPATSCLEQIASRLPASRSRERFEAVRVEVEKDCGPLIEAAPGQSDEVYELLTRCMEEGESCDDMASCAVISLGELVEEVCGAGETA